jgi:fructose-bisphosphate aldolase, class II
MPKATLKEVLIEAKAQGSAVGAFNCYDYLCMRAVAESAEELSRPAIIQTSVAAVKLWGIETMAGWYAGLANRVPVPLVLHLDHCRDLDYLRLCVDSGWTSVMFDGSHLPFEENVVLSKEAAAYASSCGVSVEAELGAIGGKEDDISAGLDVPLADPDEAGRFCERVPLDVFAPAVGTVHGLYKGKPNLDFKRLEEIARRTAVPLALHGGTGLSDEIFKRCIELGCVKINIGTQLKRDLIDGFYDYHSLHPQEYNPLNVFGAQLEQLELGIKQKITLFGGAS